MDGCTVYALFPLVLAVGRRARIGLLGISLFAHYHRVTGNLTAINRAADLIRQYYYLLKTLVVRDFKVRYKASVLGVIWSFLNPLMMTVVYLFVFSTLFRSSILHFPVYLLSGIVLFNYFSGYESWNAIHCRKCRADHESLYAQVYLSHLQGSFIGH